MVARTKKPTANQIIIDAILKKMKVATRPTRYSGGACVDCVANHKKLTMHPQQRKMLVKMLNTFIKDSKAHQSGGNIIQDLFTGKKARSFWNNFKTGFVKGFTGVSKIAAPILDVVSIFQPELAPIAAGVGVVNRLAN